MNGAHHLFHGHERALRREAKVAQRGDERANSAPKSRKVLIGVAELLMERIPNAIGLGTRGGAASACHVDAEFHRGFKDVARISTRRRALARQMRCSVRIGASSSNVWYAYRSEMVEQDRHESVEVTPQWRDSVKQSLGSRMAVDPQGRAWTVRETDATHVPGARARRSLIFDTVGCCFRVWHYPPDWRDLTTAELLALGKVTCDD
jgi:hypothetical protein